MRLIDIDDISLRKTIACGGLSAKALWRRIQQQPTIDAVSVVRCKECKYYAEHNELYINEPTTCVKHSAINHYVVVDADDFCSYGEREGE